MGLLGPLGRADPPLQRPPPEPGAATDSHPRAGPPRRVVDQSAPVRPRRSHQRRQHPWYSTAHQPGGVGAADRRHLRGRARGRDSAGVVDRRSDPAGQRGGRLEPLEPTPIGALQGAARDPRGAGSKPGDRPRPQRRPSAGADRRGARVRRRRRHSDGWRAGGGRRWQAPGQDAVGPVDVRDGAGGRGRARRDAVGPHQPLERGLSAGHRLTVRAGASPQGVRPRDRPGDGAGR